MTTIVFFLNDTATTESYTDLHTRSLHDALPIYGQSCCGTSCNTQPCQSRNGGGTSCAGNGTANNSHISSPTASNPGDRRSMHFSLCARGSGQCKWNTAGIQQRQHLLRPRYTSSENGGLTFHATQPARQRRSEEHTSELQSLMRISYAVFCLKKKNN